MSWMNTNNGVKAPTRTKKAETGGGGGFKNGDRANMVVERISIKSSDNANVIEKQGAEAAGEYINIMWRVKETADGKNVNRCVFQNLFIASIDGGRASRDAQFLAAICVLAEENHSTDGIYADIIESDEKPDDAILADLIGVSAGIVVGVMEQQGRDASEFVRALSEPYVFEDAPNKEVAQGSGRRRTRGK